MRYRSISDDQLLAYQAEHEAARAVLEAVRKRRAGVGDPDDERIAVNDLRHAVANVDDAA